MLINWRNYIEYYECCNRWLLLPLEDDDLTGDDIILIVFLLTDFFMLVNTIINILLWRLKIGYNLSWNQWGSSSKITPYHLSFNSNKKNQHHPSLLWKSRIFFCHLIFSSLIFGSFLGFFCSYYSFLPVFLFIFLSVELFSIPLHTCKY